MYKNITILFILYLFAACSNGPKEINYNKDECAHCMMTITDPKFGSELITDKGKIFKFDSIECMASFILLKHEWKVESLWISDYSQPNNLIDAKEAYYIVSEKIESPMGMNLSGVKSKNDLEKIFSETGGRKLKWENVLAYVKARN